MKVIVIGTNAGNVSVEDTPGTLTDLQHYVEGYIECAYIPQLNEIGATLIVNEEGVLWGLPLNENLTPFFFVGQALIVGLGEEDFIGLTDDQIQFCRSWIAGLE